MEVSTLNRVIDILTNDNVDYKSIVIGLARKNPELLIELDNNHCERFPELRSLCLQNSIIPAIKHVKALSDMGLKEAKEFVDEYRLVNGFRS